MIENSIGKFNSDSRNTALMDGNPMSNPSGEFLLQKDHDEYVRRAVLVDRFEDDMHYSFFRDLVLAQSVSARPRLRRRFGCPGLARS